VRPEVIFFDVGDTLVRADPSWADVYAGVFPEFDLDISRDDFHRALSDVFQAWEPEGPFEATEEASFQRLKALDSAVFARLGRPEMPDAFFRRVDEAFRDRSAWWVFPDVVPALDALMAAGVTSATSGTSPSTRTRTRPPSNSMPLTRPGHALRGLPSGRR